MKGSTGLIDWGVKDIRQDKNVTCIEKLDDLITFYGPEFVVFENSSETPSRRSLRIRHLLHEVQYLAERKGVQGNSVGRRDMRDFFSHHGAGTKHRRAQILANQFPKLAPSLPPPRKIWMSEDPRMSIFESLALVLTFWYAGNPPPSIGASADLLRQSGIVAVIEKHEKELREEVLWKRPKNSHEAEVAITRALRAFLAHRPDISNTIEDRAYQCGAIPDDIVFVGALYLRDRLFPKLGFHPQKPRTTKSRPRTTARNHRYTYVYLEKQK